MQGKSTGFSVVYWLKRNYIDIRTFGRVASVFRWNVCYAAAADDDFPSAFLRRRLPATGLDFGFGPRTSSGRRRGRRLLVRAAHRLLHFRLAPARFRRFLGRRLTAREALYYVTFLQHRVHGHLPHTANRQEFHHRPLHRVVVRVFFFFYALYYRNKTSVRPSVGRRENDSFKTKTNAAVFVDRGEGRSRGNVFFWIVLHAANTHGVRRNENISYKTERRFPWFHYARSFYRLLMTSSLHCWIVRIELQMHLLILRNFIF